jgi:hypothetical protein
VIKKKQKPSLDKRSLNGTDYISLIREIQASLNPYDPKKLRVVMDKVEKRMGLVSAVPTTPSLVCRYAKAEFAKVKAMRMFFAIIRAMFEKAFDSRGNTFRLSLSQCQYKTEIAINLTPERFAQLALWSHKDASRVIRVLGDHSYATRAGILKHLGQRKISPGKLHEILDDLVYAKVVEERHFYTKESRSVTAYFLTLRIGEGLYHSLR